MSRTILIPSLIRGPWGRALAILLVGGIIAGASAFIDPFKSAATTLPVGAEARSSEQETTAALQAAKAAKWPAYLGSLTGDRHVVDVYVGRNGPLYTVKNREGAILATQIDSEEVYARFPELSLRDMHADAEMDRD